MFKRLKFDTRFICAALILSLLLTAAGCSKDTATTAGGTKKMKTVPAGAEFSGFMKDYSILKPVPGMDGALGFASTDPLKNLHRYIACVVDPVEVYLGSDTDSAKMNETARNTAAEYFRAALVKSVASAYPVIDDPGALVLRLRAAIVGVEAGGAVAADEKEKGLTNTVTIGKVRVEIELVDSETGQVIAALVDKESLGAGAEFGSPNLARAARWAAAREAFDGWAARVRMFLNAKTELSAEDSDRADKSYAPYGEAPPPGK